MVKCEVDPTRLSYTQLCKVN